MKIIGDSMFRKETLKIVFANNYYYLRGGSERVFFDEIEILRANGHEVVPFARHFEENFASDYSRFFASPINYQNVPLIQKISTGFKLIYSFESKKNFCTLLDYFKPDLIHTHNIYGRLTASIFDAAKKRKVPAVMTLHDYKLICPSYLMLSNNRVCEMCKGKSFYNCVLTKCHKGSFIASLIYTIEAYNNNIFNKYSPVNYFICPSKFSLRKHSAAGIPEDKLIHIPNFINIENFEPNYQNNGYILYAGRLSSEKGVLTLLKAIQGLDVPVKIVGDGPMRAKYERFIFENNIKNITFEGYKSGDELKNLFMNAMFVVFPSEWYENAPMTILESFAYGKPVIGSDIGGIPEMVIDNQTGLLFMPADYLALREKVNYLLDNPSLIMKLGMQARKKVEKEYNADIHYNKLLEIYERVL